MTDNKIIYMIEQCRSSHEKPSVFVPHSSNQHIYSLRSISRPLGCFVLYAIMYCIYLFMSTDFFAFFTFFQKKKPFGFLFLNLCSKSKHSICLNRIFSSKFQVFFQVKNKIVIISNIYSVFSVKRFSDKF